MKILVLLLLISCGQEKVTVKVYPNDTHFDNYRLEFIEELSTFANEYEIGLVKDKIMNIPISFVEYEKEPNFFDSVTLGLCYKTHIIIYKVKIYKYLEKTTVFHELAHCALGLDHIDDEEDLMYAGTIIKYNLEYITRWLNTL